MSDSMISATFPKNEKLCSKQLIHLLYETGNTFVEFPFMVKTLWVNDLNINNTQVLISVPVKNFKKASIRNLIKRRIREAYRLNKSIIFTNNRKPANLLIALYYKAKEVLDFEIIQKKLILVFEHIKKQ